jgi:nickel/cobalt exporter
MLHEFVLAHLEGSPEFPVLFQTQPSSSTLLAGMVIAFGLGAMHALSPGHGKTLVSAYLIGSRGTPGQAVLLGVTTTITHTLSVFMLGLIALFASQYILPEQLYSVLSGLSGVTICVVGFGLLRHRLSHPIHHHHSHAEHQGEDLHPHPHIHTHAHAHAHTHTHAHDHTHKDLSSLITLGISGGLVPCPSALVLLLTAVALHQITYGLVLVSGFSLGLASVLIALGLVAIYAKQWLEQVSIFNGLVHWLPVVSATTVMCIGISITVFSVVH